ncbi:hypothetical protein C8J57DRAFT_1230189 [Mycena rebaudengoi]|nr:hypothetical protein C8J57DRAFT_1230189 [Mycena rebaudengoi]
MIHILLIYRCRYTTFPNTCRRGCGRLLGAGALLLVDAVGAGDLEEEAQSRSLWLCDAPGVGTRGRGASDGLRRGAQGRAMDYDADLKAPSVMSLGMWEVEMWRDKSRKRISKKGIKRGRLYTGVGRCSTGLAEPKKSSSSSFTSRRRFPAKDVLQIIYCGEATAQTSGGLLRVIYWESSSSWSVLRNGDDDKLDGGESMMQKDVGEYKRQKRTHRAFVAVVKKSVIKTTTT